VARARGLALAHLDSHPQLQGATREAILARLSDASRATLQAGIHPDHWYPETVHAELYRSIVDVLGLDDPATVAFFTRCQREALEVTRRHIHRLDTALAQLPVRWRRHHDTGHIRIHRRRKGGVDLGLVGHPFAQDPVYRAVVLSGIVAMLMDIRVIRDRHHEASGPHQARLTLGWESATPHLEPRR